MKLRTIICILLGVTGVAILGTAGVHWLIRQRKAAPRVTTTSICDIAPVRAAFAASRPATLQRLRLRDSALGSEDLRSYDQGLAVPVAPATLRQIQSLFERRVPHNENEIVFKPCLPEYQLLLTLPSSPHDVQLALCFGCEIVGIYEAGSQINRDDFDTITPELASLVKPLFPEDPTIQGLR